MAADPKRPRDLELRVGCILSLDLDPNLKTAKRHTAYVRGWQAREYILIDTASEVDPPVLRPGQRCVLRFVSEGAAWAFETRVTDTGSGAFHSYVRVSWPDDIQFVLVRRQRRIELRLPCQVTLLNGEQIPATLTDLSAGGCRLFMSRTVQTGEIVRVSCVLPLGGALSEASAEVRSVQAQAGALALGCEFVSLDAATFSDVQSLLRSAAVFSSDSEPQNPCVILVDADPDYATAVGALLKDYGAVDAIGAATPVSAIARAGAITPNAVCVRHRVGDLDACDFARLIRTNPQTAELPLLVYGPQPDPPARERLEKAGLFDAYVVTEPGGPIQLAHALAQRFFPSPPDGSLSPERHVGAETTDGAPADAVSPAA